MTEEQRIRRFDIWIVTSGNNDKHLALTESQAREYARIYNRLTEDPSRRVYIEQRSARVEEGKRGMTREDSSPTLNS